MNSSDSELEAFIPASLHKRSPIHNYFTYKKETNKSVCKKCRAEINGKNSTNLTNHLKIPIHIKSEYEKYLEELSDYKEASVWLQKYFNMQQRYLATNAFLAS
jgi:hypothetical protein